MSYEMAIEGNRKQRPGASQATGHNTAQADHFLLCLEMPSASFFRFFLFSFCREATGGLLVAGVAIFELIVPAAECAGSFAPGGTQRTFIPWSWVRRS
mmetsp:Transcript_75185/g.151147  ORF Transcript_75185/g.151147 Transcript_75185/m.151147 type:complete len:98 (+) Transcript_75185:164-457(+)